MGHIPEKLIPHINGAFPANVCLVGTVGADGVPQISPKGSVLVLDENTLAYWERGMRKAYANLKANPNVVVWYRNPELRASGVLPAGGVARFYGKAEVIESGALRDQVWDKVVEPEKKADPERKGAAVVIKLDRAEQLSGKPLE
jgi:predicted pyridoxine 5'-phosphate oxidase superfamily flavin-nucleotide-binding protein